MKQGNYKRRIGKSEMMERGCRSMIEKKEQTFEEWRGKKKKGKEEKSEGVHGDNGESKGKGRLGVESVD